MPMEGGVKCLIVCIMLNLDRLSLNLVEGRVMGHERTHSILVQIRIRVWIQEKKMFALSSHFNISVDNNQAY